MAVRGFRRPARRDLLFIVASGLLWFAVYNVTLNEAERNLDAGTAAMLVNTGPIFLALFAGLFLGEGFPPRLVVGVGIAFVGTAVIGLASSAAPAVAGNFVWGMVLCLVAAVAYAAGVTLQKPALRSVPALTVTWIACVTGMVACLPFLPGLVTELGTAEPASIGWMIYLGLFPTAVAFTTWAFALSRTAAGKLGSTTYLVAPIVIVMAWRHPRRGAVVAGDRGRGPLHRRRGRGPLDRVPPGPGAVGRGFRRTRGLAESRRAGESGALSSPHGTDRSASSPPTICPTSSGR